MDQPWLVERGLCRLEVRGTQSEAVPGPGKAGITIHLRGISWHLRRAEITGPHILVMNDQLLQNHAGTHHPNFQSVDADFVDVMRRRESSRVVFHPGWPVADRRAGQIGSLGGVGVTLPGEGVENLRLLMIERDRQPQSATMKFWASFRGLGLLFDQLGESWLDSRDRAVAGSESAAATILKQAGPDGVIPAVFEPDNADFESRILPACEGLLYPFIWGEDISATAPAFFEAMYRHTKALLRDAGKRNLFPNGGIRLSSTSNNSWMSKIAIFQHIARHVLHLDNNPHIATLLERADAAHVTWQTEGSAFWACCDQIVNGVAKGSRYYPRVITAALWLDKNADAVETPQVQLAAVPHV
jgi:hypothetical protein